MRHAYLTLGSYRHLSQMGVALWDVGSFATNSCQDYSLGESELLASSALVAGGGVKGGD